MTKAKTTPETAAYLERAAVLRGEARAAFESRRDSSRSFSPEAERDWLDRLRLGFTARASRGDLPVSPTVELAWAFSEDKLSELLAVDAEGKEAKAARAERRRERGEVAAEATRVLREQDEERKEAARVEAAERLGLS